MTKTTKAAGKTWQNLLHSYPTRTGLPRYGAIVNVHAYFCGSRLHQRHSSSKLHGFSFPRSSADVPREDHDLVSVRSRHEIGLQAKILAT
jgi:hypothetical protein